MITKPCCAVFNSSFYNNVYWGNAQYILITRIKEYLKNIFKIYIFYTKFLIYGKIGHLKQMRSKMWTYKHWQYLNDEETDVAQIVTQSTLTYNISEIHQTPSLEKKLT